MKLTSASQKEAEDPTSIFLAANTLARKHGIGRIDIVENGFIGLKLHGCYETPGLTLPTSAPYVTPSSQSITPRSCIMGSFSLDREFLEPSLRESQKMVNGQVRVRLYKGNVIVLGRSSSTEKLYD